jgi:hypothetical protein
MAYRMNSINSELQFRLLYPYNAPQRACWPCREVKKKKADLIKIATELGMENTSGTIPERVPHIQEHLRAHQELAADPKFQKLFMIQPGAAERNCYETVRNYDINGNKMRVA